MAACFAQFYLLHNVHMQNASWVPMASFLAGSKKRKEKWVKQESFLVKNSGLLPAASSRINLSALLEFMYHICTSPRIYGLSRILREVNDGGIKTLN
jgi:hypothetical protein